jgi:NADP-dependent 3-hydroxy acid dehydrogenase YdfG
MYLQVVIASRNLDKLKATAEELKGKLKWDHVFPVACNIRKEEEVFPMMACDLRTNFCDFL